MSEEAKMFITGLNTTGKGMVWYGKLPGEIVELFGLSRDFAHGWLLDKYVEVKPRFENYEPEWLVAQRGERTSS